MKHGALLPLILLLGCPEPGDSAAQTGERGDTGDSRRFMDGLSDKDGDGWLRSEDCDDADPWVHPGADEWCNGQDDDCDGEVDEPEALNAVAWYQDEDGDGYGVEGSETWACEAPAGTVSGAGDCDDGDAAISPAALELCENAVDEDCDGEDASCVDIALSDADATFWTTEDYEDLGDSLLWYPDMDGDGLDEVLIGGGRMGDGGGACLWRGPFEGALGCEDADVVVLSASDDAYAGAEMALAGDLDDDGLPELVIGASRDSTSLPDGGAVYFLSGASLRDGSGTLSLGDVRDRLLGSGRVGSCLSSGKDIDGDAQLDTLVCAEAACVVPEAAGALYLWSGMPDGPQHLDFAHATVVPDDAHDDVTTAAILAEDQTGDGIADLWFGSWELGVGGQVNLVHGPLQGTLHASDVDGVLVSEIEGERAGSLVADPGDMDGDGRADLLVGAEARSTVADVAGGAYLVTEPPAGTASLEDAQALLLGVEALDWAGSGLAGAGDMDGDGWLDIVVDANWADDKTGRAYVFLGPVSGTHSLADADVIVGGGESRAYLGMVLAGGGDADGDGLADLLVGAPGHADEEPTAPAAGLITGATLFGP